MYNNNLNDNRYYSESQHHTPKNNKNIILIAVISALIGALVMAVIAPNFIYGKLIPWPSHLANGGYNLPGQPPKTPSQQGLDLKNLGNQFSKVANNVGPAVVGITNKGYVKDWFGNTSLTEKSSGTGFIVDSKNGYVVTNEHVISGAKQVIVTLASGTKIEASVVGSDNYSDLAVLKIDISKLPKNERELPFVEFGDSSSLQVGHFVLAIGNPLGAEFARTTTHGIVSAVDRTLTFEGKQYSLIQIDAAINSGNSGGPLLDLSGNVVGINTIKIAEKGVEGLGFAIPSNQAKPLIEQLIKHGRVIRPYLGITGTPFNSGNNQFYKGKVESGVYVVEVNPNSPVDKAGMKAEDIITKVNGEKITSFTDLQSILYKYQKGDLITVTVYRNSENKTIDLEVTLAAN